MSVSVPVCACRLVYTSIRDRGLSSNVGNKQMAVITSTAAGLSRWVGEAMATLQNDRERARALQRENAQVSRGAAMTQKEVLVLENKLFKFRKEVRVFSYDTVNGFVWYGGGVEGKPLEDRRNGRYPQ